MKTLFLFAITAGLISPSNFGTAPENSSDDAMTAEPIQSGEEVFELLSEFLMAVNKHLLETATAGNYSDADFRSWAAENYGSVRAFRSTCREIQMGLEKVADKIGSDLHTPKGADRVIDHILGSREDRLNQIARADNQQNLKACYEAFVGNHQSCLASTITDGLFEYQDWHSGAQLLNCMASGVREFHDCAEIK